MYKDLAGFYDNGIRDRFSEVVTAKLIQVFEDEGFRAPSTLLDLGCGTCRVAVALAKKRYEIIGLDSSERMLDIAGRRAKKERVTIDLRIGDIRDFKLEARVDAAFAFGDVVNHFIGEDELVGFLSCVFDSLFPGGVLLFDVNTLRAYQSPLWNTENSRVDAEHFSIIANASFAERRGIARIDMQVLERTHFTEHDRRGSLRERYWPDDTLRTHIEGAGFEVELVETFHPLDAADDLPDLAAMKAYWLVRRP